MRQMVLSLVLLFGAVGCGAGQSSPVEPTASSPDKVMPELVGLTSEEAVGVLQRAGISYVVREESGTAVPAGSVVRTEPPGGAVIRPADVAIVYVHTLPAFSPSETAPKATSKKQAPHVHETPSDVESFLNQFAEAWGAQDTARMRQFATAEVVKVLSGTGPGEASVVGASSCLMGSSGSGGCEVLFMPATQTECCAQIWELSYREESAPFGIQVYRAEFMGDAG